MTAQQTALFNLNLAIDNIGVLINGNDFCDYPIIHEAAKRLFDFMPKKSESTIEEIEKIILPLVWGGSKTDFHSNLRCRRAAHVVSRRFVFMFARLLTKETLCKIGLYYCKDHSSVISGIDSILFQLYHYENINHYFLIILRELENAGYDVTPIREAYNAGTLPELLKFRDDKLDNLKRNK